MSKSCPVCVHMEREVKAEGGDGDPRQGRRLRNIDFFNSFFGRGAPGFQPWAVQKCISPAAVLRQRREGMGEEGSGQKMPI